MRRVVLLAVCLLCLPLLSGCLCCAYPRLDGTREVQLASPPTEVRAFRVDVTEDRVVVLWGMMSGDHSAPKSYRREALSEVPVSDGGEVPWQLKASVSYSLLFPLFVVNAFEHSSHTLALRLYRPGYELVEIRSWEPTGPVVWKPVPDLEGGVLVLDRLFKGACGSRAALLFGASEYERLAMTAGSREERKLIWRKGQVLRDAVRALPVGPDPPPLDPGPPVVHAQEPLRVQTLLRPPTGNPASGSEQNARFWRLGLV
jgi:hypothetical protein